MYWQFPIYDESTNFPTIIEKNDAKDIKKMGKHSKSCKNDSNLSYFQILCENTNLLREIGVISLFYITVPIC